jgi:hypothetical protein
MYLLFEWVIQFKYIEGDSAGELSNKQLFFIRIYCKGIC